MTEAIQEFFTALHGAMVEGEKFKVELTKKANSLEVLVLPLLSDKADQVPEAAQSIRAALTLPLVMSGMGLNEIASEFGSRLSGYGDARSYAKDAYDELLASIKDATASAKNKKQDADKKADTQSVSKPETNPESLPDSEPAAEAPTEKESSSAAGGVFDF